MTIYDIIIDDGYDEGCLKPGPQHTIRLSGAPNEDGECATIIVGFNDSDIIEKNKYNKSNQIEVYTFTSGIIIELPNIEYWKNDKNNSDDVPGCQITINPYLHFDDRIEIGTLRNLTKNLDNIITKQKGRELSEISRVSIKKGLSENIDSKIGSFLTGKTGSTRAQMNKLKQNMGIQGAPRAGGTRKRSKHPKYS